jgi:abhydrolase domain-containing protein 17
MFNRLIFPAPNPSYGIGKLQGELLHIPRTLAEAPSSSSSKNNNNKNDDENNNQQPITVAAPLLSTKLSPSHYDFGCGIFIRSANPNAQHIVMYSHPNAFDIGHMRAEFVLMARHCNVHCFLVEFQGYGLLQACSPSEQQATEDGFAAYNFITQTMKFPANKLIMMGRSIGTGVTCAVASQLQEDSQVPLAVLLQCPFTSIKACVKSLIGKNLGDFASEMVGERFENVKNVKKIKCPVTIIHGTQDKIVPFSHGVEIVQAAVEAGKEDTMLIQLNCDHNDIPLEPGFDFIKKLVAEDTAKSNSSSTTSYEVPTGEEIIDRIRPYFCGPSVFHEIQDAGRSRPMPLTNAPNSPLPDSVELQRGGSPTPASKILTSPFSHLSQTLTYNIYSFLSLVRTSWELYQLCREESLSHASGSEQVMQYVTDLAPSVISSAVSAFRARMTSQDKSSQLADAWKLSDYIELCSYLWGHPLSLGTLSSSSVNNQSSKKLLIFGSSSRAENVAQAFDSNSASSSSTSHYDEIWAGSVSTTLQTTFRQMQEYNNKVKKEHEEFVQQQQQELAKKILDAQKAQQQEDENSEKAPLFSSSSATTASSTDPSDITKIIAQQQLKPFKSSLPPFNTASVISQNSVRTENFSPSSSAENHLFWVFPKTLMKVFCDNIEKSKRSASETMKRVSETSQDNSGFALKPQPVTEKGSQFVQIEVERFVISNLLLGQNEKESFFQILSNCSSSSSSSTSSSTEVQTWQKQLDSLLQSPFLDGVLLPLPVTVDSSAAMQELLELYRKAPSEICVQPAVAATTKKRSLSSGNKAVDCVIQ